MKFYGNGAVWDGANNKVLCTFIDGELTTEDEHIISELYRLQYSYVTPDGFIETTTFGDSRPMFISESSEEPAEDDHIVKKLIESGYKHDDEDPCETCQIETSEQRCVICELPEQPIKKPKQKSKTRGRKK